MEKSSQSDIGNSELQKRGQDGLEALWAEALRPSEAWFILASDYEKNLYRDAGRSKARSGALEKMMKLEIRARLGSGELLAIGNPVPPDPAHLLAAIPALLFEANDLDWDGGLVIALGRTFHSVRVCVAPSDNAPQSGEQRAISSVKMGRPTIRDEVRVVIDRLRDDGRLEGQRRKEQIAMIQEECRSAFPESFPKGPSRSLIMDVLKIMRA